MTKALQSASIAAPGFLGLNTQESSVTLQDGFALRADNCVIDKSGRLGARKGWLLRSTSLNTVDDDNVGIDLLGLHHFVDFTGLKTVLSWSIDTFYQGLTALETLVIEDTTNDETITTGNWSSATLNDLCFFFQEGYFPLVYDPTGNTGDGSLTVVEDFGGTATAAPKAGFVMSAFGRLWCVGTAASKTIVYFSDLNDGTNWTSGSAGSLDI